jgi:hypothetical protein
VGDRRATRNLASEPRTRPSVVTSHPFALASWEGESGSGIYFVILSVPQLIQPVRDLRVAAIRSGWLLVRRGSPSLSKSASSWTGLAMPTELRSSLD